MNNTNKEEFLYELSRSISMESLLLLIKKDIHTMFQECQ
jgi:hypothetical protein